MSGSSWLRVAAACKTTKAARQTGSFEGRVGNRQLWVASPHAQDWPRISTWQGDADHAVSRRNAHAIVDQWGDVHGADPGHSDQHDRNGNTRRAWNNAQGETVDEAYSVKVFRPT